LWCWSLNSGPTSWATLALFCNGFFWDRVLWTICVGWLWTEILLISASWVARMTGVSHQHLTDSLFIPHLLMDIWAVSACWSYGWCCCGHLYSALMDETCFASCLHHFTCCGTFGKLLEFSEPPFSETFWEMETLLCFSELIIVAIIYLVSLVSSW
jgi:hypothetical protein